MPPGPTAPPPAAPPPSSTYGAPYPGAPTAGPPAPGGYYGAPGGSGTGYGQWPAPAPRKGTSATVIVLSVLAAVVLLGGALAAFVVFAVGEEGDDTTTAEERREEAEAAAEADGPAPGPDAETATTAPAPQPRVPVDAGDGLTWTMRSDPTSGPTSTTDGDGLPLEATLWVAEEDGGIAGDLAITFDLEGRTYSRDEGLRGVVANSNGTTVDGPSDVTIAGRPGRMIVAQIEADGTRAVARYAVVVLDGRVLLVAAVAEGEDVALGQQAFADLVASVAYP